ncbi:capsule biosynthesis protein, partial [Psychrobacter sp. 1Y4]
MKSISTKQKSKIINFSLFIGLVILPWLLVIYYVMTLAHPRFVSTADVVVKQVSDSSVPSGGGLSALLGVNSTSKEDATYLTEYILSNDMVKRLDNKFKFREAYYVDGSDPIYEIDPDATQEDLLEYFKKRVHIDLDEQSYVLSVSTEGFDSKYAFELNKAILGESERFVNRISQEVARDQLAFAETQLDESEDRLNNAKEQLL